MALSGRTVRSLTNAPSRARGHARSSTTRIHGPHSRRGVLPADIWGTSIFDGAAARRGYALNKMCYSFNDAANRDGIPA